MTEKIKKIISAGVLISLLSFYFVAPFTVKKADAFLGIADITFNTTLGDIPRLLFQIGEKIVKFGLERLKKRMLTQIQNDLVNWVQNSGEPRFIKDPVKFLKSAADSAAVKQLDEFFLSKSVDICSPFKAQVRLLVSKPLLIPEERLRCSLGDIVDNLEDFAVNFEDGGWTAWLKLHETRNTLPGSYLAATELIGAKVTRSGNAAQANISAGKGFLDQKRCSETQYPVQMLRFETHDGFSYEDELDTPSTIGVLFRDVGNPVIDFWEELGTGIQFVDVDSRTIDVRPTGEYVSEDHSDSPIGNLPPGAKCTKEETITPGSIIGDQISGVLEKTGIDNIINSNDIAQILNAVIDAAVNRAAREGLSYMKSGRGSYTQPFHGNARASKAQQLPGLESPDAINLQNQIIDLRNAAQKLKLDTIKLTGKENNLEKLKTRLSSIGGALGGDENFTGGIVNKDLRRRRDGENELSKIMDGLFSDRRGLFGNNNDFNKEETNPGLYLANQAINQKISDIWQAIDGVFRSLSEDITFAGKNSCVKVGYTLESEDTAAGALLLPFFDVDGKSVGWVGNNSYVNNLKGDDGFKESPRVSVQEFKLFALEQSSVAETKSIEYELIADSYESLTQNSEGIIESLENDMGFATSTLPEIILYTSALMDYDRAGREFNLIQKIKTYTDALSSVKSGNDNALKDAYTELRVAQRATRNLWLVTQQNLLTSGDADQQTKANVKINGLDPDNGKKGIAEAIRLIAVSLDGVDASRETDPLTGGLVIDPTQLGLSVSGAVAEAMDINKDSIRSEMEERQLKIGQQQTDVSNRLGTFITNRDERKEAGISGGDSEWEKYFKNRFQLIYSAFIYDFYKNHFVKEMCSGSPAE